MSESPQEITQLNILKGIETKKAITFIIGVSLAASAFLVWLIYFNPGAEDSMGWTVNLPYVNATLNGISTILLILGFQSIRKKKYNLHMKQMIAAFVSSTFFLVSYIVYHTYQGDTSFEAEGLIRYIYFFILITHIFLSLFVVPLVLTTFYFSLSGKISKHRKIAKITFPIWLYVSVTGVLIVVFLKGFNP